MAILLIVVIRRKAFDVSFPHIIEKESENAELQARAANCPSVVSKSNKIFRTCNNLVVRSTDNPMEMEK